MLNSTKTIVYLSFLIVGVSLFLIILLGVQQSRLNREYGEISSLSERTLFSFATLREQVTEALISRDYQLVKGVIPEVEALNNNITLFFDSDIIPAQYKLALTDKIDLAGLVIDLRKVAAEDGAGDAELKLQQDLRIVADNLFKIDRVITGQIRNSVVNFQLGIIGAMGLIISCASFLLILLYRKTISPILGLSGQLRKTAMDGVELTYSTNAANEIKDITTLLNEIIATRGPREGTDEMAVQEDYETISNTINETANHLNTVINYAQLLLDAEPEPSAEQKQMLKQVIDSCNRIAEHWQKTNQRVGR